MWLLSPTHTAFIVAIQLNRSYRKWMHRKTLVILLLWPSFFNAIYTGGCVSVVLLRLFWVTLTNLLSHKIIQKSSVFGWNSLTQTWIVINTTMTLFAAPIVWVKMYANWFLCDTHTHTHRHMHTCTWYDSPCMSRNGIMFWMIHCHSVTAFTENLHSCSNVQDTRTE